MKWMRYQNNNNERHGLCFCTEFVLIKLNKPFVKHSFVLWIENLGIKVIVCLLLDDPIRSSYFVFMVLGSNTWFEIH